MTQPLTIHFPGKLVFGNGSLANLADEIGLLSLKKVLVVTIAPLLGTLAQLVDALEAQQIAVQLNTSIVQEPSFADFDALMQTVTPFNPDVVVGIGGGSVLDIAKLVAAQLENDQTLADMVG
ncbi:MAG: iron-containing alcohol dehydrogenase, partial [Cytophagaceae bacterium]